MKLKEDDQSVDASVLLKRVNKIFIGGDMEASSKQRLKEWPFRACPT